MNKYYNNSYGCPSPILGVDTPNHEDKTKVEFDFGGKAVKSDFSEVVKAGETDTSLLVDSVRRVLKLMAERHIDSISASTLGQILHLSDIGDVKTLGAKENALFVYQKGEACGAGCATIGDSWTTWNALDHQVNTLQTVMGFDKEGKPQALSAPQNKDQVFLLGWNKDKGVSYIRPVKVSAAPRNGNNKKLALYLDEKDGSIVAVEED